MKSLKDKVAVITGAASGIGKALAIKCLELEMKVVLVDIEEPKLNETLIELKAINKAVVAFVTNVANEIEMLELAINVINLHETINFVFNNAGIVGSLLPIWEQSTDDIKDVLQVNLLGTIYGIKAFLPIMLNQGDECFIINTSAGAGLLTGPGLSAYKASKHAVIAISEVLFADLKQINANV